MINSRAESNIDGKFSSLAHLFYFFLIIIFIFISIIHRILSIIYFIYDFLPSSPALLPKYFQFYFFWFCHSLLFLISSTSIVFSTIACSSWCNLYVTVCVDLFIYMLCMLLYTNKLILMCVCVLLLFLLLFYYSSSLQAAPSNSLTHLFY